MAAPELVSVEFPEEETENFGFMALGKDAVLTVDNALEDPAGSSNLLAIANGRGLFAIAVSGGFIVNQTSTLRDKFADPDKTLAGLVHHIPEPVQFLTFTSDERHLIVVGQAGGMAWYFVDNLRQQDAKPRGFFKKGPLLDIKCNPRNGTSVAVLAGNRNVYHIDLPTSSLTTVSSGQASSFDWAANGQQLVVGHTDGVLIQHTISGETLTQIAPPPDIQDKFIIFLLWIELDRFLAIYSKPPAPNVHEYELFVITREPNKITYSKIFDSCPPFGLTSRQGWWYSVTIRNWSREKLPYLILLASSPSIDIALMTEKHTFYLLDDTKRASLPFHKDKDTSPVGVALDLTATDHVLNPKPGVEDSPALPILWVLNNVGQVKAWNIVWGEGVAENIADVNLLREQHKRIVDSAAVAPSLAPAPSPAPPSAAPAAASGPVDSAPPVPPAAVIPVDTKAPAPAPPAPPAPPSATPAAASGPVDNAAPVPPAAVIPAETALVSADATQDVADKSLTIDTTAKVESQVTKKPDDAPELPESEPQPDSKVMMDEPKVEASTEIHDDEHVEQTKTALERVSLAEPKGEKDEQRALEAQAASDEQYDKEQVRKQDAQPLQLPSQLAGSKLGFAVPSFGQKSATTSAAPAAAPVASAPPSLFSQYANAPSLMEAKAAGDGPVPFSGFGQTPGLTFGAGLGQQARMGSPLSIPPVASSPASFGGTAFGQAGLPGPSLFGAYTNRPAFAFGQSSFGQPQQPAAVIKPPGFPVPPSPPPPSSSPFGQMADKQSPFGQFANQQQISLFSQPQTKVTQPSAAGTAQAKTESSPMSAGGGAAAASFGARLGPTRNVGPDDEIDTDQEEYDEGGEEYDQDDDEEEEEEEEYDDENSQSYDEEYDEEEGEEGDEGFDDEYGESEEVEDDQGVTNLLARATVDEADAVKPSQERSLSTGSLRANAKEFRFSSSRSPSQEPASVSMERKPSSLIFDAPDFVFKPESAGTSPSMTAALQSPSPTLDVGKVSGVSPAIKSHAIALKPPPPNEMVATRKEDIKPTAPPMAKPTEEERKSVLSPTPAQKLSSPTGLFSLGEAGRGEEASKGKPADMFSFSVPKSEEPDEATKSLERPQQVAVDKKPDGLFSLPAPRNEEPSKPTDQSRPTGPVAAPIPERTKSATPLIDVDSKRITPTPEKAVVKMPELDSIGTAEEKVQEEENDDKMESEEADNVSDETERSLLNVDEAPLNLKFSTVPPQVPEYLQMSSLEEYESKEQGLVQVFDRIYHDTSNELDILRRNVSQLSKFLEAHTAQHLMRRSKEDFNEPEEWRLAEISNMTAMIDELMQEARTNNIDDAKHESGLHEVAAALLKLDSKLTTAGEVLKQRSDPKYTSRLRTRALPPDALELQREIRQKMQEVSKRLDELERENTLVKSKLSAVANNLGGADVFGTAPSLDGVYKSIQRITRFAQRRALDVSSLQKALGLMQEDNSNTGGSPRTPRLAISGNSLYQGTPESSVYTRTPVRSDKEFGGSPQKLNIDEETVDELIARKKTMRKLRRFILERPESAVLGNGK
ncbi:hypothetical protein V1509DRAFT_645146 [Lipomyces kononenkoae]